MRGERARNEDGPLRANRSDTRDDTIEEMYHRDFGVRGDMQLGTLLKRTGAKSLSDLLKRS
jgi:hypothetical protein